MPVCVCNREEREKGRKERKKKKSSVHAKCQCEPELNPTVPLAHTGNVKASCLSTRENRIFKNSPNHSLIIKILS